MTAEFPVTYTCHEVVVGWGLECLLYAYHNRCPAIITENSPPHPFDLLHEEEKSLENLAGNRKLDLYNFLIFNLSMNGLLPFAGQIVSTEKLKGGLRVVIDNTLVCFFSAAKITKRNPCVSPDKKIVLDWINVRSGLRHEHKILKNTSNIANCIHFFPSERIDGSASSNLKDLAVLSYMTNEEILDSNYSQFHVRMRTAEIMRDAGIRGPKNGIGRNGQRYRPLLLENYKREVYPLVTSKIEVPQLASTSQVVYL